MLTSQNTTRELSLSGIDTALIAFGSTEQCGPYLPMHLDSMLVEIYAKHYSTILNAYQLPVIPFNTSEEHSHFKGTVTLSPQLLMALTEEIVDGLIRQGFKKFVIVSGHGGASWITPCVKHLNYRYTEALIIDAHHNSMQAWQEANEAAGFAQRNDVHGGLASLCTALYLCPDLIDFASLPDFGEDIPATVNQFMDYMGWERITPDGSWGRFVRDAAMTQEELTERGRLLWTTFVAKQGETLKKHFEEACRLKFGEQ